MRNTLSLKLIVKTLKLLVFFSLLHFSVASAATQTYTGVGLLLDYDPPGSGNIVVYSVSYKSPADKAKIKRGYMLVQVDGVNVSGKPLVEVAKMIRGAPGTQVTLGMMTTLGPQQYTLQREQLLDGPVLALPAPSQLKGPAFTDEEKTFVKEKILRLTSDEERDRMRQILQAFKEQKLSKVEFLHAIETQFPN